MSEIKDQPAQTAAETAADAVKTLLFYVHPVALNRDAHRDLRLVPKPGDYSFAKSTNSVPIAAVEFADACGDYPIVFAGPDKERLIPAVLVGLKADENLFVGSDRTWAEGYVPAFVRRYPFVLAEKPDADDFTVCIDESYPGFDAKGKKGEVLFDDDGKESPYLKRALDFLGKFQGEMARTRAFVKHLDELGLLVPKVVQSQAGDQNSALLSGFHVVDEEALRKLDADKLKALVESGEMGWIYMHLLSLRKVSALSARMGSDKKAA